MLLALILLATTTHSQTYFASAANPADNGTNSTSVVEITPPGSMVAGDLVVLIGQSRAATSAITMALTNGGQTWQDAGLTIAGSTHSAKIYWCRFNGNWAANPQVEFASATATSVTMHVFRPSAGANTWDLDQLGATATYAAPGGPPYIATVTGQTTVSNKVVAVFVIFSTDDNTYIKSAGTATVVSSAQYRNLGGNDIAHAVHYEVFATGGTATGDLSARQTANGPDAGATAIVLFKEYTPTNKGIPIPLLKH